MFVVVLIEILMRNVYIWKIVIESECHLGTREGKF
jgi:hypothetical protein